MLPKEIRPVQTCEVRAYWDNKAQVWWAESDDVIGLVAESRTHDALIIELRQLVPELLTLNVPNRPNNPIVLRLVSEQIETISCG